MGGAVFLTPLASTGVTDHLLLTNIGVNSHVQIDAHIADATIHFTEASIDHLNILNVGVNTHAQIDSHIADATVHFTVGSIDHGAIAGLGDDDHPQYRDGSLAYTGDLDMGGFSVINVNQVDGVDVSSHVGDASIHYSDAPADGMDYVRNNNAWVLATGGGSTTLAGLTDVDLTGQAQFDLFYNATGAEWRDTAGQLIFEPASGRLSVGDAGITDFLLLSHDGSRGLISTGAGDGNIEFLANNGSGYVRIQAGTGLQVVPFGAGGGFFLGERAAAATDVPSFGQIFADTSQDLIFRDSLGVETSLLSPTVTLQAAFDNGNTMDSTTAGVAIPDMTEVQRDAIGVPASGPGTLIFNTDTGQVNQWNGAAWTVPGGGLTTLQNAYDNSMAAVPMILLDGTPTPMTFRASVSGSIMQLQDVGAANTIFEVTADPDTIVAQAGVTIRDPFLNAGAGNSLILNDTFDTGGAFIGGGILSNGLVGQTVSTTWIWALLQESKIYEIGINPAFAAFTLFNALPVIRNRGNFNLPQGLILNAGLTHQRITAGTSTTAQTIGLSFASGPRTTTVSGAVMTYTTGMTAVQFSPNFGTLAGTTVNLGTLRGLWARNPAGALFQPTAGTENMTAYVGVEIDAIPFGGNVTKRGIRSSLAAATNTRFLDGLGTAQSDLRGQLNFPVDLVGNTFGASGDWSEAWAGGGFKFEQQNTGAVEQFRKSFPAAGRMLFDWSNDMELNINCVNGFSLGAQSGANGNQFGNFVGGGAGGGNIIPGAAGDYTGYLLTWANSYENNGLVRGRVSAWVINGFSYANSSGTVTEADTLTVGGMVTSAPGVTVTNRQALNVIGGRSTFQSAMGYRPINPAALSAGNNNDWAGLLTASANNGMRHWARVTPDGGGTSVLTGIDSSSAQDGDCFKLTNIGTVSFDITHNDVASGANNRILTYTIATLTVGPNESVEVIWDAVTGAWRVLYGSA